MPRRPKSICRQAGCGALLDAPGFCAKHVKAVRQQDDARRGTAQERGYDSKWSKARVFYLHKHPLCVYCKDRDKRTTAASVVDHIKPHRLKEAIDSGNEARIIAARLLFWDSENWQSLCAPCHNSVKQADEKEARRRG